MNSSKHFFRSFSVIAAGLALLLCSGCITISEKTYEHMVAYAPIPSPVQIDANASIEVSDTLSPDQRAIWKKWMNNDNSIEHYLRAMEKSIRDDFTNCGLFSRIVSDPTTKADYEIKVVCYESHPADFKFKVTVTATETATGTQVSSRAREHSLGRSMLEIKIQEKLPGLIAQAKADLAADLQAIARQKLEQAQQAQAELLTKSSLTDLLVTAENGVTLARARNRALVAAKTQQLPYILRNWKTDELTALTVKIEQTILDLNHECEVAKDQAQQSVADGSSENTRPARGDASQTAAPIQLEETRGLAICYRERIELLKPILTLLKEEIANRSR